MRDSSSICPKVPVKCFPFKSGGGQGGEDFTASKKKGESMFQETD